MAALVSALDTKNSIQYGENNHIEYSWSETQQEQICQLYFQLVRTKNSNQLKKLKGVFRKIYEEGDTVVTLEAHFIAVAIGFIEPYQSKSP